MYDLEGMHASGPPSPDSLKKSILDKISIHILLLQLIQLLLLLALLTLHFTPSQKRRIVRQRLKPKVDDDKGQWYNERHKNPPPVRDGEQKAVRAKKDGAEKGLHP